MDGIIDLMSVAAEEHTCRICQLEGSTDHPLFYPCSCRGSIKYIHQDCLEEWLKRSGRDGCCDICHEQYRFTTVYDENTPGVAPFKLITLKTKTHLLHTLKYLIAYGKFVFGSIQVPLFWAVSRRFIDWIIDSSTTHNDFLVHLIYGDAEFTGDPYSYQNLSYALRYTFVSSVTFLVYFAVIHLLLFLEHEWVSKDDGFNKLINKNIGIDQTPQHRAFDRNRDAILRDNRPPRNDIRNIERAFPRPQQQDQAGFRGLLMNGNIRVARNIEIADGTRGDQDLVFEIQNTNANIINQHLQIGRHGDFENDDEPDPDYVQNDDDDDDHSFGSISGAEYDDDSDDDDNANNVINYIPDIELRINDANEVPDIPDIPNFRIRDAIPIEVIPERHDNNNLQPVLVENIDNLGFIAQADQADQAARPDRNPDDFVLSLPTFVIIIVIDCFLDAYLIVAYLIPSLMGTLIFQTSAFLLNYGITLLFEVTDLLKLTPYLNQIYNEYVSLRKALPIFDTLLNDCIFNPVWNVLLHVYEQKGPLTKVERFLPLVLFYSLGFASLLSYMNSKARDFQRNESVLRGIQRKVYIIIFDLVMTSKVFLIFFIELFLLPTFCGFLLEFAVTPIFDTKSKLVLNDIHFINYYIMLRLVISWACGTGYMCLFTLYIGMCRRYILRPGLLYFIRSPEDPNTQLVHDALVRPLYSQLSKVGLSGLVYTLFVLIGFGTVTRFLKYSGTPLLPFSAGPIKQLVYGFFIGLIAASTVYHRADIVRKYVRQYWNRAFTIAATKTRLCSFTLGIPDSRERGYVVYRNLQARLRGAKPNYGQPTAYSETKELFRTTNVQALFVPDGNLVRAPKHDTISRKFIKDLFIPVTKDDIPLKSEAEIRKQSEKYQFDEFDDSEDEKITTNSYEIVYRPPLFGLRVICFIALLWVFSVFLICGVLIFSNIIGKPVVLLLEGLNRILGVEPYGLLKNINENGFLNALLRMELVPLASGLGLSTLLLEVFDNHTIRAHLQKEGLENDSLNDRIARFKEHLKNSFEFVLLFLFYFGSQLYIMAWNALVHYKGINEPFKYLEGIDSVTETVILNKFTFPIHGIVFLFTYFRWFLLVSKDSRDIIRNGNLRDVASRCFIFAAQRFVTTHLVLLLGRFALVVYEFRHHPENYTDFSAASHYILVEEAIYGKQLIFMWPAVLVFAGFVHLSIKGFKYFQKINAEVIEEHFSKGKTLENRVPVEGQLDVDTSEI